MTQEEKEKEMPDTSPNGEDCSFFSFDSDRWERAKRAELARLERDHRPESRPVRGFSVMFDPSF